MAYVFLTARKLKPGTYDDWRRAWEPDEWPEGSQRAYILRNSEDPDEIVAFGFFEGDLESARADERLREQQKERFDRMAPFVEATGTDGVYEVLEEVAPTVRA